MDTFHKVVIFVSIFVLFSMLISVAMLLDKGNNTTVYPPSALTCPDYWTETNDGCQHGDLIPNGKEFGTINFKDRGAKWAEGLGSMSETCAKKSWANNNDVLWDGISNYNGC